MSKPERDPYTGLMTTEHEWNGIKELRTPVPKTVWFFLILSTIAAVILWILYPAWPLWNDYTKGVLGVDQHQSVQTALEQASAERAPWENVILNENFATLQKDASTMEIVRQNGARLFTDNCSVCHGAEGLGGHGFPNLVDTQWLWGGDADTVMETITVGINSEHDDTRFSQMMPFGDSGLLTDSEQHAVATYVLSLSGTENTGGADPEELKVGQNIFATQCATCHGDDGRGTHSVGAPNLTDAFWIYGGDRKSISTTIRTGRMGVMPSWENRLSEVDRKTLTLYVLDKGTIQR
jgi:cytochrome c oxidase cbb3-type subunit 3